MTRRVRVQLVDDLDGGPAQETVRYGLDGVDYEIDLSAEQAGELRQAIAPFVAAARRLARIPATQGRAAGHPTAAGRRPAPSLMGGERALMQEMRQWADANGFPVSQRGRISREVREAFQATPPEVRAEQAATFAELADTTKTAPTVMFSSATTATASAAAAI